MTRAAGVMASTMRRLASLSGDGAMTLGGPDHRHASTKAVELVWRTVHAELEGQVPDMTTWVAFDRIGVAADCAIQKVPMAKAVSKRRVYTMPHRLHVVG